MRIPNLLIFIVILASGVFTSCSDRGNDLTLVKNGEARSVIILPENSSESAQIAAFDFIRTVERSTGAKIEIIKEKDLQGVPESFVKIILGPGSLTDSILGGNPDLLPEEYKIITKNDKLLILANDIGNISDGNSSAVSAWAFSFILDNYLGVRWLWPGELGTFVPIMESVTVPALDTSWQPPLVKRNFRARNDRPELLLWCAHHQVHGQRKSFNFSHSFLEHRNNGNWWVKFSESHPEYLAQNPDGQVVLINPATNERFKLNVSNPAVVKEIVKTWEEDGMPDFWPVTPNDSRGFCTCDECMELDRKYGKTTHSKEKVWSGPAVLTDRYVWFWNHIVSEMRKKNPDAQIGTYFYSAFRNPPESLRLEPGIIGGLVHGYDFSLWEAWEKAGASGIALRPNWWHMGACAPHLPLSLAGNFVEKARKAKMIYIDMDSLMEYWAAQGPYYYLIARLIARPDLSVEEIIDEYCNAFGEASPEIRRYLTYWQEYHKKVAYNIPAGGGLSQDTAGIYETVCREHFGSVLHPLKGHWLTVPYIYTPSVLLEAYHILDDASAKTKNDEIEKRISFLRDGLNQLRLVSEVVSNEGQQRMTALENLMKFPEQMEEKYGYWGSNGVSVMKHRGVLGEEADLRGM